MAPRGGLNGWPLLNLAGKTRRSRVSFDLESEKWGAVGLGKGCSRGLENVLERGPGTSHSGRDLE